jgi:glycerol-3-phosphate dehydrogenase (NAD(P)+)
MNLRVAVLGGGSWGTTVATLASHNAPTVLWARRAETVTEVNEQHTNERYLPGARLPEDLRATGSLEEAVRDADVLVVGVPSHVFRQTLEQAAKHVRAWVPVVSLAKGLEQGSLMRMTEVIAEVLPGHRAGVLTGPNLAREIMAGFAAASVIGMEDESTARALQKVFHSGLFRVYTNSDAIGCETPSAARWAVR